VTVFGQFFCSVFLSSRLGCHQVQEPVAYAQVKRVLLLVMREPAAPVLSSGHLGLAQGVALGVLEETVEETTVLVTMVELASVVLAGADGLVDDDVGVPDGKKRPFQHLKPTSPDTAFGSHITRTGLLSSVRADTSSTRMFELVPGYRSRMAISFPVAPGT
jgi:hypothetical protein